MQNDKKCERCEINLIDEQGYDISSDSNPKWCQSCQREFDKF